MAGGWLERVVHWQGSRMRGRLVGRSCSFYVSRCAVILIGNFSDVDLGLSDCEVSSVLPALVPASRRLCINAITWILRHAFITSLFGLDVAAGTSRSLPLVCRTIILRLEDAAAPQSLPPTPSIFERRGLGRPLVGSTSRSN